MTPSAAVLGSIAQLVAFRTTFEDSNLPLIDHVAAQLDPFARIRFLPDPSGRKANLFATIGPEVAGGIILSGHSDVVPAPAGDPWSSSPFAAEARGGRLYGRGTVDMKGFVGTVVGLAPRLAALSLRRPIHLALSYDEEVGCVGVWGITEMLRKADLGYAGCIVGEPTGMAPIIGHKGKTSWSCEVTGKAEHSSRAPYAVNAVELAARMIAAIADLGENKSAQGPFDPLQDPPHSTLSVGPIAGGRQLNVVPDRCRFEFELRHLPEDPPGPVGAELERRAEALLRDARRRHPDADIRITETNAYPGFAIDPDAPIVRLAERLSGHGHAGRVAFGTEAGIFQAAGIPTVVCGPGDVAQAHTVDEFIALDQLAACEAFVLALGEALTRDAS